MPWTDIPLQRFRTTGYGSCGIPMMRPPKDGASTTAQRAAADSALWAQKQNIENQMESEAAQMTAGLGSESLATRRAIADYNARAQAAKRGYTQAGLSQLSGLMQQRERYSNLEDADRMRIDALRKMFPSQTFNYS